MKVTPTKKAHRVIVGDHVRAWDHMPMEGREDRYVEGIVTKVDGEVIYIHVVKDTVFDFGVRLEIITHDFTFIGEYEERIQVLGHTCTISGIYTKK